jgi:hypothetical protein
VVYASFQAALGVGDAATTAPAACAPPPLRYEVTPVARAAVLNDIRNWRTRVALRPTRTNHFDERYRMTCLTPEAAKAFWQHPGLIYFVVEQERVDREAEERMRRREVKRERKLEEERETAKKQREDGEVELSERVEEEEGGRRTPMDMHWESRCCSLKRVDDDDW